jgi:hypothetical protein
MRSLILAAAAAMLLGAALAGPAADAPRGTVRAGGGGAAADEPIERGTLRLHYVQKPIGYERYTIARDGDRLRLSSDFDFTDRGGRVQLAATLRTRPDYTPIAFTARGKSYRFVSVDSEVRVEGRTRRSTPTSPRRA